MLTAKSPAPVVVFVGATFVLVSAAPALADGFGRTECVEGVRSCELWAGTDGAPADRLPDEPLRPAPASGPDRVCTIPGIEGPVECVSDLRGWLADDGCYYKLAAEFVPTPALAEQVTPGVEGSWYQWDCPGVSTGSGVRWIPDTDTAALIPPTPQVLGERARGRLRLPEPRLGASPSLTVPQLVGVPVWLWLEPGSWAAVSATAAVPGVAVSATAAPTSVTWDFGPGGRVVCDGPGTPYVVGVSDPDAASPDCGIVFAGSSEGLPGGEFPVTVTVSWDVGWAGPGGGGVFPGLASTATAGVVVGESQAVVVGGGR